MFIIWMGHFSISFGRGRENLEVLHFWKGLSVVCRRGDFC